MTQALAHVAGVTLCNEGTVRDWMRHGKFNVTQGKNFDASGSIGPWIVTADEIDLALPCISRQGSMARSPRTPPP